MKLRPQVWKSIETQIKKIEQKLKEQAEIDPNETIYRSATGFGPLSARILSNELGDRASICSPSDNCLATRDLLLLSFPAATQSAKAISLVKGISAFDTFEWQAAWRAIKKERELKAFFERLAPRTGKKRAIVAVARKLIGRLRAAF